MTDIFAALVGAIGVVLVAVIGALGASKLGVGANQEKLVTTLKDLISVQDKKIEELESNGKTDAERIHKLEKRVQELEDLTVSQAQTIHILESRLGGKHV